MNKIIFNDNISDDAKLVYCRLIKAAKFCANDSEDNLAPLELLSTYVGGWVVNDHKAFSNNILGYKDVFTMFSCLTKCMGHENVYVFPAEIPDNYLVFFAEDESCLEMQMIDIAKLIMNDYMHNE